MRGSLPRAAAYKPGNSDDPTLGERTIESNEGQQGGDVARGRGRIAKTSAIDVTMAKAREYAEAASAALDQVSDRCRSENTDMEPLRQLLKDVAIYTVDRAH